MQIWNKYENITFLCSTTYHKTYVFHIVEMPWVFVLEKRGGYYNGEKKSYSILQIQNYFEVVEWNELYTGFE